MCRPSLKEASLLILMLLGCAHGLTQAAQFLVFPSDNISKLEIEDNLCHFAGGQRNVYTSPGINGNVPLCWKVDLAPDRLAIIDYLEKQDFVSLQSIVKLRD